MKKINRKLQASLIAILLSCVSIFSSCMTDELPFDVYSSDFNPVLKYDTMEIKSKSTPIGLMQNIKAELLVELNNEMYNDETHNFILEYIPSNTSHENKLIFNNDEVLEPNEPIQFDVSQQNAFTNLKFTPNKVGNGSFELIFQLKDNKKSIMFNYEINELDFDMSISKSTDTVVIDKENVLHFNPGIYLESLKEKVSFENMDGSTITIVENYYIRHPLLESKPVYIDCSQDLEILYTPTELGTQSFSINIAAASKEEVFRYSTEVVKPIFSVQAEVISENMYLTGFADVDVEIDTYNHPKNLEGGFDLYSQIVTQRESRTFGSDSEPIYDTVTTFLKTVSLDANSPVGYSVTKSNQKQSSIIKEQVKVKLESRACENIRIIAESRAYGNDKPSNNLILKFKPTTLTTSTFPSNENPVDAELDMTSVLQLTAELDNSMETPDNYHYEVSYAVTKGSIELEHKRYEREENTAFVVETGINELKIKPTTLGENIIDFSVSLFRDDVLSETQNITFTYRAEVSPIVIVLEEQGIIKTGVETIYNITITKSNYYEDFNIRYNLGNDNIGVFKVDGDVVERNDDFTIANNVPQMIQYTPQMAGNHVLIFNVEMDGKRIREDVIIDVPVHITGEIENMPNETIGGLGEKQEGETVNLVVDEYTGYSFLGLFVDNDRVFTEYNYSFLATDDTHFIAKFERILYNVTATADPEGSGTFTGTGTHYHNDPINVRATPKVGCTFTSFEDTNVTPRTTNSANPYSMNVNATDINLVGKFANIPYSITASSEIGGELI